MKDPALSVHAVTVIVPLPEVKSTGAVPRSPPVPLKSHVMALAFEGRTRTAATNPTAMPIRRWHYHVACARPQLRDFSSGRPLWMPGDM